MAESGEKRQNIRRLMSGIWGVFAALLLKDGITAFYEVTQGLGAPRFDVAPPSPPATYMAMLAVAVFLWKQAMDCYIYFAHIDDYRLPPAEPRWLRNFHILVDNCIELGVMVMLVVLVHDIAGSDKHPDALVGSTWKVAISIEALWLAWDASYAIKFVRTREPRVPTRAALSDLWNAKPDLPTNPYALADGHFRRWTILNSGCFASFWSCSVLSERYLTSTQGALLLLGVMVLAAGLFVAYVEDYFLAGTESQRPQEDAAFVAGPLSMADQPGRAAEAKQVHR